MKLMMLFVFILSSRSEGDVTVADYSSDYCTNAPLVSGWQYLWNAPDGWVSGGSTGDMTTGKIGDPSCYQALTAVNGIWTADGDTDGTNHNPDRYVRLISSGGHPGAGTEISANTEGRYAIAAYTVSSSGFYALENTRLYRVSTSGDTVNLFIHINDRLPVYVDDIGAGEDTDFDTPIGYLTEGDTLYVGVGPGGTATSDSFQLDFSLVKKDVSTVAGYRDDFQTGSFPSGWKYQWNCPDGWVDGGSTGDMETGEIGDPSCYADMQDAGTYWTADGDTDGTNHNPDRYVRLTASGGHPGAGTEISANTEGRCAIAAYTAPSNGFYAIANSFLTKGSANGDSVEVLVHVNAQSPILRKWAVPESTINFDTEVGRLKAGDVIYVAVGPDGTANSDGFSMDYEIVYMPMDDVYTQVNSAYNSSQSSVRIYPGRYYTGDHLAGEIIMIDRSDFDINAYGVQMIIRTNMARAVLIRDSANVTVRGLEIDYDPLLFSQGTITNIVEGSYLDMQVHEGYPPPTWENGDRGMVHDPVTLRRKVGSRDVTWTSITNLGDNVYRIYTGLTYHEWEVGDYITLNNYGRINVCQTDSSTNITYLGTVIYSGYGWTIHDTHSSGCIYDGVQIKPGPRPLLASVDRLRSSHSDGIHSTLAEAGPIVENCHLEGLGDDAVAISSSFGITMADSSGSTIHLGVSADFFEAGDQIRIYRQSDGVTIERTITSITSSSWSVAQIQAVVEGYYPDAATQLPTYDEAIYLTLDASVTIHEGDLVSDLDRSGEGYSICNNYIANTRARGIIVKASNGVIESNVIEHVALPGILMNSEAGAFIEGDSVHNVIVRNNILNSVSEGWQHPWSWTLLKKAGAVTVIFEDRLFRCHENIWIEDNLFMNNPGLNIQVNNAEDVEINRNVFVDSHQREVRFGETDGADNSALVWCDRVDGVTLGTGTDANYYYDMGAYGDSNNTVRTTTNSLNVSGTVYCGD